MVQSREAAQSELRAGGIPIDTLRALAALAMGCALALSPAASAQHATGADLLGGEQAYQNVCANCHGSAGNQIANVDLGHAAFRKPYTDEELTTVVLKGIPGTAMPANPNMARDQAVQIVAYLRSRGAVKDAAAGGDAARGKALFAGKGECASCHRVDGVGSPRGPELSRIGRLRTSDQLAASLLEPQAEVQPQNRSYAVTLRDGRRVAGRLLNHDSFSVQLLDEESQLRSFDRRELRDARFIPSPMPSVRGRLDETEVADLVQYLVSLRGAEKR